MNTFAAGDDFRSFPFPSLPFPSLPFPNHTPFPSSEGGRLFEGFIRRQKMAAQPIVEEDEEEDEKKSNGAQSFDDSAIDASSEMQPIMRDKKES